MRLDQQQSQTTLRQAFEAGVASPRRTAKSSPRLTLRFTEAELERLQAAAADMSLSAYVRKVLFSCEAATRRGRSHRPVADQEALARVLGLLGQSAIAYNLNRLASEARTGCLPLDPPTLAEIEQACACPLDAGPTGRGPWADRGPIAVILKASQRAGAKQLAWHLLNERDNEHVSVHELRGFVADNLVDAFNESYALSRGTRCTQFLFSLSLSPPERESVPVDVFEKAITEIEAKVGLAGQPRAIVFHEKEGRRHAHCVWSRIDPERMRAINLPHFKVKLRDVSRRLYIEHGWRMPTGLIDSAERDPLNFSRAEWQQARRTEQDARALKALFQECWAASDSAAGFQHAVAARGLMLARGDRRGVVAVDFRGEVYAVARWAGIPTKAVRARLGDGAMLKPVAEVRAHMASRLGEKLTGFADEAKREFEEAAARLEAKRRRMVISQRGERRDLADAQARRGVEEARARSQRLRKGLLGIWDRVVGRHAKMRRQNEVETDAAARRDAVERQAVIDRQLVSRRELRNELRTIRSAHLNELAWLKRHIADTNSMAQTDLTADVGAQSESSRTRRRRFGPSL